MVFNDCCKLYPRSKFSFKDRLLTAMIPGTPCISTTNQLFNFFIKIKNKMMRVPLFYGSSCINFRLSIFNLLATNYPKREFFSVLLQDLNALLLKINLKDWKRCIYWLKMDFPHKSKQFQGQLIWCLSWDHICKRKGEIMHLFWKEVNYTA